MTAKRKSHSPSFKARVALEAVKGLKPVHQLAREYEINPNLVSKWKKQLVNGSKEVFESGRSSEPRGGEANAKLYEQIGRLKVELEWLKKKSELFD